MKNWVAWGEVGCFLDCCAWTLSTTGLLLAAGITPAEAVEKVSVDKSEPATIAPLQLSAALSSSETPPLPSGLMIAEHELQFSTAAMGSGEESAAIATATIEETALLEPVPLSAGLMLPVSGLETSQETPATPVSASYAAAALPPSTAADVSSPVAAVQLAQVSEVAELTDVAPTDWAYQAVQSLVEEYACLEGLPDQTFRGDRPMSRYEFAAGLNACLDVIRMLVGDVEPYDLQTVQRLSEEFAVELSAVTDRVDTLEADVAELRANQFATQTKLRGVVFAHLGGGFADGDILAEGTSPFSARRDAAGDPIVRTITEDPQIVFGYYTWINLDTSFTGADRLTLQLASGDASAPANKFVSGGLFNTFGTPFTSQTGTPQQNSVIIRELSYGFPIGDRVTLEIGPRINWYRFFDNNRYTFFLTGANSFNSSGGTQVNAVDRGAGAIAVWNVTDWLDFRVGYLAENTEFLPGPRPASDPSRGLFGGTNTLTAQVAVQPFEDFNLRLLYTRSNIEANAAGLIGGAVSEPLYGFADDGAGGRLDTSTADTFLVNFDWTPLDWLGLFGRYSYGSTNLKEDDTRDNLGEVNAQSFQFGVAFPDLFKEGALGTISYVIPFDVLDGREFLVSGGGDGGTQQEVEVSYRYPLSPNIAIMPSVYWIINANNFEDNPDIFLFNLQTQLFF